MLRACLDGVKVLDLSQFLPGPYAAQILADLGAAVVKVEPPAGDPMRGLGPVDGDGVAAFYKLVNAGKAVVRLDLKSESGRRDLEALVARADALIESFRPGALAKLGFGPDALKAMNPKLVHCALSGYGQSGPYALKAGHDINYMALGGGLATSGAAARPVAAHPPTADYASGMQAALATLAALLRRGRTGQGAFLDVSLMETVLAWQPLVLTAALRPGHEPARGAALLNGGAACYNIYETADGRFVTLGAIEDKFWANFCRAVDQAGWVDRQWEAMPQRDLVDAVATLFKRKRLAEWEALLGAVDCCFQAVVDAADVPDHPQVAARGLVQRRTGPDPLVEVLFPALMDAAAPAPRAPFREGSVEEILTAWGA